MDDFSVRFSPDVVLVDENAFNDSEISEVILNDGLETIADRAFYSSKLKNDVLILPASVTSLGDEAFASIYREVCGFSHIELPEGLKSIGESVFSSYKTDLVCDELLIGKKLTNIAEGAFKGLRTTGFEVDPGNSKFSSENGCLLDAEGETLITAGITDIYIGPDVTSIHPQAIYLSDKEHKIVIHGRNGSEAEHFAVSRGYEWKGDAE